MNSYDMQLKLARDEVESKETWRKLSQSIPAIQFPPEVSVKIIPPFCGATARFIVIYKDKSISVYLDHFSRLGCMDEPYWEAYPINGDCDRYHIDDVAGLVQAIKTELELK